MDEATLRSLIRTELPEAIVNALRRWDRERRERTRLSSEQYRESAGGIVVEPFDCNTDTLEGLPFPPGQES